MKNTTVIYWNWCWALRQHSTLCLILRTALTLSLKQRKEWLSLARTQSRPISGSYLASTLDCTFDTILVPSIATRFIDDTQYTSMSMREFYDSYYDPFLTPITASIIALAVRICPSTTANEYRDMLLASVSKEITASTNRFSGARLDFRPIFSSDYEHRELPFSDRMVGDSEVASDTYMIFCRLRRTLHNRIFFPSVGSKTVGSKVAEKFWDSYHTAGLTFKHDGRFDPVSQVTTRDCLKMYEQTGGYPDGPVEMRHTWKYNQIAPRVYFARGGTVLLTSQYLQPIVNEIIDAFPETHRYNRFAPPEDLLKDNDVEVIYDYASFTSTLEDVVLLVDELAKFFSGTVVHLLDVREGLREIDLGDLLSQYNRECNEYASFDTHKVLSTWIHDSPILQHTCGMLGIEGNIFLATLLHGIHLRFIAGLRRSKCVGDDARFHYATAYGSMTRDDKTTLNWQLAGIGDINPDKIGQFEPRVDPELQAFRYVKRPLRRDRDIMVEGLLFEIPSLIPLFPLGDDFHTILPSATHPCRKTFKSVIRMLRLLKLHNITLETNREEVSCLASHIHHLMAEVKRVDPTSLHAPFAKSDINTSYRLPRVTDWGRIDYEDWVMDGIGLDQEIRFLKRGGGEGLGCDGRVGSEMVCESNSRRSFLVKMGYMEVEDLFDVVSLRIIGPEEMRKYISGDYRAVCKFKVIDTIPSWYSNIPNCI